jgi:hypothetical protein
VRPVVLDTSVVLPATLSPRGYRFLEHLTDIDLDHVDPGLLAVAFGPLA